MATYQITKVRMERSADGLHEHIGAVELSNREDQRFLRQVIVNDLRNPYGDRYYTFAGGVRADVVVMTCPRGYCTFGDYITTHPDQTIDNNLLHLPRF